LRNVEGCGEGCVWLATIADEVVRDVDPNLAYFDDVTFCYDVITFFRNDEKACLECRPELDENAFCLKIQFYFW
jgi:hypothetical protein